MELSKTLLPAYLEVKMVGQANYVMYYFETSPSGQNRRKSSLLECIFYFECFFGDFAHWVNPLSGNAVHV